MRLTNQQRTIIRQSIAQVLGQDVCVKLFGSRVDDFAKGGDIDLLIQLNSPENAPAELAAKMSALLMRKLNGRKVDILLSAPNLTQFPIHKIAQQQGVLL